MHSPYGKTSRICECSHPTFMPSQSAFSLIDTAAYHVKRTLGGTTLSSVIRKSHNVSDRHSGCGTSNLHGRGNGFRISAVDRHDPQKHVDKLHDFGGLNPWQRVIDAMIVAKQVALRQGLTRAAANISSHSESLKEKSRTALTQNHSKGLSARRGTHGTKIGSYVVAACGVT